jgi:hypothetical protein
MVWSLRDQDSIADLPTGPSMIASEAFSIDDDLRALFTPFALKAIAQIPSRDLLILEECVRAAIREMRTEGFLPENIIIRLRQAAVASGVAPSDRLLDRLIRWTVNEYFSTQ